MDGINAVCRRLYGLHRPAVLTSPSAAVVPAISQTNGNGLARTLLLTSTEYLRNR